MRACVPEVQTLPTFPFEVGSLTSLQPFKDAGLVDQPISRTHLSHFLSTGIISVYHTIPDFRFYFSYIYLFIVCVCQGQVP